MANVVLRVISLTDSSVTRLGIHGIGRPLPVEAEQAQTGDTKTFLSRTRIDLSRLALLLIVIDWPRFSPAFAQSLASLIITAPNLTELRLSLGEGTYANGLHPVHASIFCLMTVLGRAEQPFAALKSISLDHVCCFEEDLRTFLSLTAISLERLELGMVYMLLRTSDGSFACGVKFLEWLRGLDLRHFAMKGILSNTGKQHLRFCALIPRRSSPKLISKRLPQLGSVAKPASLPRSWRGWRSGKARMM